MKNLKILKGFIFLLIACCAGIQVPVAAGPIRLTVKLRGVYDSKITLTPFNGVRFALPLAEMTGVKNGDKVTFEVPGNVLPGEFLVRFDYRGKPEDQPYPSELQLYLNRESIGVDANPPYLHGDSLKLTNDRENAAFFEFAAKSEKLRQPLGLLLQLLGQYDAPSSAVWKRALKAYEKRRKVYNLWIDSLSLAQRDLYVSHLYPFQRLQAGDWKASEAVRLNALAQAWFSNFNFTDTLALKSRQMNEFMNGFMGLYGVRATTEKLRDSLFTEAGSLACGQASKGHPKVYGWMVDYFYNGFETYNITSGLEMLEKHSLNPNCLTSRKVEISRRSEGIKKLIPGVKVPDFVVQNYDGKEETIAMGQCDKDYRLLVFYDSECGHCTDLLSALRKWYDTPENKVWLDIVSIALDRTREDWEPTYKANAYPWADRYAPGGVNSQAASAYYVLSTPYMYLIDKEGKLVAISDSVEELDGVISGK